MKTIFKGIVGSTAFGLATEKSDIDHKSIYIQTNKDLLSNKYIGQTNYDKDFVGYELRRFLELVSTGNPNALELLYLPENCIVEGSEVYQILRDNRDMFLSKKCFKTYIQYAKSQLKKATGLNKKFNWEKSKTIRKNVIDFCNIVDRESGKISSLNEWLTEEDYSQTQLGLVKVEGFRNTYKVYTDDLKWANENMPNHRYDSENIVDRDYRGVIEDDDTNQPRTSEIEDYRKNSWKGIMYWNLEEYSSHCRDYGDYQKWLKERNEDRVATNKQHGQQFDSKNISHLVRLIMTAEEIPTLKTINVDRTKEREYLLSIKNGELDLKQIIQEWTDRAQKLEELYNTSDLKDDVDFEAISQLELSIREKYG